jgi:hypothetical protein
MDCDPGYIVSNGGMYIFHYDFLLFNSVINGRKTLIEKLIKIWLCEIKILNVN